MLLEVEGNGNNKNYKKGERYIMICKKIINKGLMVTTILFDEVVIDAKEYSERELLAEIKAQKKGDFDVEFDFKCEVKIREIEVYAHYEDEDAPITVWLHTLINDDLDNMQSIALKDFKYQKCATKYGKMLADEYNCNYYIW